MAFLKVFSPHCILHTTLWQEIIHYQILWFECNLKVTFTSIAFDLIRVSFLLWEAFSIGKD